MTAPTSVRRRMGRPRGRPNVTIALTGDVVGIVLPSGHLALVDGIDYPLVANYRWSMARGAQQTIYAIARPYRPDGSRGSIYLHALLVADAFEVDHVNRDGLNNRRSNLRPASATQNQGNRALSSNNTSGYKGVTRQGRKWRAAIRTTEGRRILGRFDTAAEAAAAYDAAATAYWGDRALTNAKLAEREGRS